MGSGWAVTTDHLVPRTKAARVLRSGSHSTLHGVVFAILCLGPAVHRRGAAVLRPGAEKAPAHAAFSTLAFPDASSVRISCAGRAALNRKPCIWVHPRFCTVSRCCRVSTPSAVVTMLRSAAMLTTARMIEADEELRVTSLTKERSILILSNGKRCRYCSEE